VPKGFPPPTIMQQSIGWLGDDGRGIRYQYLYPSAGSASPAASLRCPAARAGLPQQRRPRRMIGRVR